MDWDIRRGGEWVNFEHRPVLVWLTGPEERAMERGRAREKHTERPGWKNKAPVQPVVSQEWGRMSEHTVTFLSRSVSLCPSFALSLFSGPLSHSRTRPCPKIWVVVC